MDEVGFKQKELKPRPWINKIELFPAIAIDYLHFQETVQATSCQAAQYVCVRVCFCLRAR